MNAPSIVRGLAFATLLMACTNAQNDLPPKKDAAPDNVTVSTDVAPDEAPPSPDLRPAGDIPSDVADLPNVPDVPVDRAPDTTSVGPDTPSVVEARQETGASEAGLPDGPSDGPSDGPGDGAQTCYWQTQGGRYGLKHFTFLLTTPDGQAQRPPSGLPMVDAGSWPINDFEGLIASKSGNQFAVDSCIPTDPCQSSLYRFTLCDGLYCAAASSPAAIELPIPLGRRVRVVWHLDNYTSFCPGLYWLAIYDAEPGPTQGNLLFLGSGGQQPTTVSSPTNYFNGLPFSVAVRPLGCGNVKRDGGGLVGDDYAFVFSPKSGAGATVELGTGQSGYFTYAASSGNPQRLLIRCLDAVQPAATDDYWNWDLWATGEATAPPTGVDGGG